MAAETGFQIDGTIYEVPSFATLDLDERYILFDYCKLTQEDFLPQEGETEEEHDERVSGLMKHPAFWPALQHIAYRREHRDLAEKKIKQLIADANRDLVASVTVMSTMRARAGDEDGEDAIPPASTTEPDESSSTSSVDLDASSGGASTSASDEAASVLATTGTTR